VGEGGGGEEPRLSGRRAASSSSASRAQGACDVAGGGGHVVMNVQLSLAPALLSDTSFYLSILASYIIANCNVIITNKH